MFFISVLFLLILIGFLLVLVLLRPDCEVCKPYFDLHRILRDKLLNISDDNIVQTEVPGFIMIANTT